MQEKPKVLILDRGGNTGSTLVSGEEALFGKGARVSNPLDPNKVHVSRNPLDTDGLTSAEKELGYLPELNFEDTVDENAFRDIDPAVNEAINIVTDLRLKAVGKLEFTQEDKDRLNYYNDYITYVNITNDVMARQEQERVEAQALKLVEDAEALLDSSTNDKELDTICAKVEELVQKLGPRANRILPKLQMLKARLAARPAKNETK